MSELHYTVELTSGERFTGAAEARGEVRVVKSTRWNFQNWEIQ